MLKQSNSAKLQQLLNRADIPLTAQREVHNGMYGIHARREAQAVFKRDEQWRRLMDGAKEARLSLMSNKPKWPEFLAPLYSTYTDMLSLVVQRIEGAASEITPEGIPLTLPTYTSRCRVRNERRVAEGKHPLATCGASWQSWIPAHKRREFALLVEAAYAEREAADGAPRRGKRFVPFMTAAYREQTKTRVVILTKAIKRIRTELSLPYLAQPMATSAHAALVLMMMRKAERRLNHMSGEALSFDAQVPVRLAHLLEPKDRKRLAEADANPMAVDFTQDILPFYAAPTAAEELCIVPYFDALEVDPADEGEEA